MKQRRTGRGHVPALAVLLLSSVRLQAQQPTVLATGFSQDSTLGPGPGHVYLVTLEKGGAILGEADQHGIDLVIDISGPDGKLIRTVDSPNGSEGPEPIDLTASRPGRYMLVIHTLDAAAKPGRYTLKIQHVLSAEDNAVRLVEVTEPLQKLDAVLTFIRQRNAVDYAITTPNGIDEAKYVTIGGIEQWITIRGEDRRSPVILFLHGGPGDAISPWGYAGFQTWLKRFTVVQWDQRGAGRTLGRNGASIGPTITIDRMVQDGIELAELLRRELKQDKIILVGHSWGSVLGVLMAKARPDLFAAYVGTGQVAARPARTYSVAYAELLNAAERRGEARAVAELKGIGPPPWRNGRGFQVQRKWANRFEHADLFLASTLGLALQAPGDSLRDVSDWLAGQQLSAQHLVPQASAIDSRALGGDFTVPVFVIQGAEDFTTPASLARGLVDSIHAPRKAFVPIEGGGHFAVFTKSDVFLKELTRLVAPVLK